MPLLIPHPSLTHGRTAYALAKDVVHHVGEAVVMVVAEDRYVAEDAAERIRVTYEPLPAVVGVAAARDAESAVHPDVPDNVAAHVVQETGDVEAALAAAPHVLDLDLEIERSASTPMEGRGVYARWDGAEGALRIYSSTQTSTGVRAAVAARLGPTAGQGRVHRPGRRRGLRSQDRAPMAGGGDGLLRRPRAGP